MSTFVDPLENIIRWVAGISGVSTLALAVLAILLAQSRPTGVTTGSAKKVLKSSNFIIATLVFCGLAYVIWKPLPIQLSLELRVVFDILGGGIFFCSLILYLWGLRALGTNFNASSGFGVRLHKAHQLVKTGPYACIRHPMYLAVILASWSGLLLYRTWTMLAFAVIMLGLLYRARKEEEALEQVFGEEWHAYKACIPGWIPRLIFLQKKNNNPEDHRQSTR